jgi:hypothetical protein
VWLALASGVACIAVALALADLAASIFVALVGVPIAAYAAIAQLSRTGLVAALIALTVDACVLVYWAVVIIDALQGVR